jgi:hypothetical protein
VYDHPILLEILDMGDRVVPYMLRHLKTGGSWYDLIGLTHITQADLGQNAVPGNFHAQQAMWLDWGRENGLISEELPEEQIVDATTLDQQASPPFQE